MISGNQIYKLSFDNSRINPSASSTGDRHVYHHQWLYGGISSFREVDAVSVTSQCEGPSPKSCLKPVNVTYEPFTERNETGIFQKERVIPFPVSLSDRQRLVELLRPGNDFLGLLGESTAHILKTKLNLHIGKL